VLPLCLGPTDSCMSATRKKTFPTTIFKASRTAYPVELPDSPHSSSFEYLLLLPRSALAPSPLMLTPISFDDRATTSYSLRLRGRVVAREKFHIYRVINFQGYSIWQLSCYTLPSEYRLPWPSYCCLHGMTPFMVSDECKSGTLPSG